MNQPSTGNMMAGDTFEDDLNNIEVPQIPDLKHQASVRDQVLSDRHMSALMVWVVALPLYVIACAAMKTFYHRALPFQASFDEIQESLGPILTLAFFLVLPLFGAISIAAASIRFKMDPSSSKWLIQVRFSPSNVTLAIVGISIAMYYLVSILL